MFSPFTTEIGLGDFPIATTVKEEGSKALELRAGQKKKKKRKREKRRGTMAAGSGGGHERVVARNANNCLNGSFREAVAANWPVREKRVCRAMCGLSSAYFYSTRRTAVLND